VAEWKRLLQRKDRAMSDRGIGRIEGLRVGSAHDAAVRTGVTIIVADEPMTASVDVRGGGPGTRETDAMQPGTLVDALDALCFSGGSVYGLAAADEVTALLGAKGRGVRVGTDLSVPTAPIVPAAILFDLANGGDKQWGETPPYRRLAREAFAALSRNIGEGRVGAGFGARAGGEAGGIGTASADVAGVTVAALVAVNSIGSVRHPGTRAFYAWPFEKAGEFGGARPWDDGAPAPLSVDTLGATKTPGVRQATTLVAVATDAALTVDQCKRLAIMSQDGLARAIRPVHTPYDGDVVFALSSGRRGGAVDALTLTLIGSAAADCVSRAISRGVFHASQTGWT
jgi:L-aminopeptidase/D-esterase-like protein